MSKEVVELEGWLHGLVLELIEIQIALTFVTGNDEVIGIQQRNCRCIADAVIGVKCTCRASCQDTGWCNTKNGRKDHQDGISFDRNRLVTRIPSKAFSPKAWGLAVAN